MKFLLAFVALFAIVRAAQQISVGTCQLVGTALDTTATGNAYFVQETSGGNVTVTLTLSGITSRTNANHGFHVHAFGNISDTAAANAVGSHYVGSGSTSHGCPSTDVRHEGDMGNVFVNVTGAASWTDSFDLQTLIASDPNSIIGHGAIFHNNTDDCAVTTSSGSRLAQCVIGIANPEFTPASVAPVNFTNTAGNQAQPSTNNRLFCFLQATNGNGVINGFVDFQGVSNGVQVTAVIQGLSNTNIAYGLHIHTYGDLTGNTGNALGGHYNPTNSSIHGIPPNSSRHLGDLGNICGYTQNAGASNTFYYQYTNTELSISGIQSFIGRGIALHNKTDVQGATAYGPRVAHGVIGVANASLPQVAQLSTLFTNIQSADCAGPVLLTPTTTPTTIPSTTSPSTTAPATTAASTTGASTTGTTTSRPTNAPITTARPTTTSSASAAAVASFAALVAAAVLLM